MDQNKSVEEPDMQEVNEELLMAYADGELDPKMRPDIEKYLAANPEARELVAMFQETSGLVHDAYHDIINEPVPESLIKTVHLPQSTGLNWLRGVLKPMGAPVFAWSVSAACLALMIGFGGGMMTSNYFERSSQAQLFQASIQTEAIIQETIQEALETQLSGTAVRWQDQGGAYQGAVVPIRTFRNTERKFCREFRVEIERDGGMQSSKGIACRDKGGNWVMRIRILDGNAGFLFRNQSL